jgi:hypothetical protein
MATQYAFGKIVTDGLVLCLDAADRNSYVSGSTTWSNIVGSNTGSLINGPTFNTGSGGNIVFDGVDDYVQIPTFLIPTGSFSCESFFQWSSLGIGTGTIFSLNYDFPNTGYLIRQMDNNTGRFVIWSDYGSESGIFSTSALTANTWNHVTVIQNSGICSIYINGVLDSAQSLPNPVLSQSFRVLLGARATSGSSAGAYLPGRIAVAKIYNRALSAQEVAQNYNAQKSRFGL